MRTDERNIRSDSNVPRGRIWAGMDLTTVFLRGVRPTVSGSEWHFWILSNGCPPFLATQKWARRIINSIFYLSELSITLDALGKRARRCIYGALRWLHALFLLSTYSQRSSFSGEQLDGFPLSSAKWCQNIGFWKWPPDTHLCFLRDPRFKHSEGPQYTWLPHCWLANGSLGCSRVVTRK